jgi:hypothetical protein
MSFRACGVNHVQYSHSQHSTLETAAASVTADVPGRVWQEMEYRLDICRAATAAHTELR